MILSIYYIFIAVLIVSVLKIFLCLKPKLIKISRIIFMIEYLLICLFTLFNKFL